MAFAGYERGCNANRIATHKRTLGSIALDLPSAILIVSALIKVGMYLSIKRISKQTLSPTLATNRSRQPQ
jgi:hypothetical protein